MSIEEANGLVFSGRLWFAHAWLGGDDNERNGVIFRTNAYFDILHVNARLGRGWQSYDPVVRTLGKCHRYSHVATWASSQTDGGVAAAQLFRAWYSTNTTLLSSLPAQLQALAIITHLAEVGRGYLSTLNDFLHPWIDAICNATSPATARTLWRDYENRFPPSLTYAKDIKEDWN